MRLNLPLKITTLLTLSLGSWLCSQVTPAQAAFDEQSVEQADVIAIARPFGQNKFDLLIIEQIPGKKQCWSEKAGNPVTVDPLLLNFDFTGICKRATDSNGYSIRLDGQDLGLEYILRLVEKDGELVLVGTPRTGQFAEIVVGRTRGMTRDFMKIQLDPGWRFARRSFQGKPLGHYYFSGKRAEIAAAGSPGAVPPPTTSSANFKDITNDIYKAEIEQAVALGIVAGFKEDNTFRPTNPVTREQLVSMVIDAINTVNKINLNEAPEGIVPFTDVAPERWSAKKIKWAQSKNIVSASPDGKFRPTDPITRTELMAIMQRMAEYLQAQKNITTGLVGTKTPVQFADISGHWGQKLITQMSGFCGVASPLNEVGKDFAPNEAAQRNYAAAAIIRTLKCVKAEK
jgi:hypothetical protein